MLASIEEIIEDAKNGKMFILVDDESRENEGDVIIPAEKSTPEIINFMAKYARGLVCVALTAQRCDELKLPMMTNHNTAPLGTAFTVSVEAKEGVTTGISAYDRNQTVKTLIDVKTTEDDLVVPGHMFPLRAKDGGVIERCGHTEAAVDICKLAGLYPAGVICEVMKDDGNMARLPDLEVFAKEHNIKIASIADLIAYRRKNSV